MKRQELPQSQETLYDCTPGDFKTILKNIQLRMACEKHSLCIAEELCGNNGSHND
jgi:hypothetical protein